MPQHIVRVDSRVRRHYEEAIENIVAAFRNLQAQVIQGHAMDKSQPSYGKDFQAIYDDVVNRIYEGFPWPYSDAFGRFYAGPDFMKKSDSPFGDDSAEPAGKMTGGRIQFVDLNPLPPPPAPPKEITHGGHRYVLAE